MRWSRMAALLLLLFALRRARADARMARPRPHRAGRNHNAQHRDRPDAALGSPDYSPLLRDFDVSGNSSSRQFELVNGVASQHMLFAVALQPQREGLLTIPSLRVGNLRTQAVDADRRRRPRRPAPHCRRRGVHRSRSRRAVALRAAGRGLHRAPVLRDAADLRPARPGSAGGRVAAARRRRRAVHARGRRPSATPWSSATSC